MPATFGVVDLFAGPGGLGEGFASFEADGHSPFEIGISVEKETSAHRTLRLRAFVREYRSRYGKLPVPYVDFHATAGQEPDWADIDRATWLVANAEARCLALGTVEAREAIDATITQLRRGYDDTILIGGPPCQAYSLVGRARSRGKRDYVPEKDERHFLFREYIAVLDRLRPAAFIMENVKGMLSSTVDSRLVFEMLMEDLGSLGTEGERVYELRAITVEGGQACLKQAHKPSDFIVQAEQFGVPQRRHRLIIVGVRSDLAAGIDKAAVPVTAQPRTVADVIGSLPRLRSGLSRTPDSAARWHDTVVEAMRELAETLGEADVHDLADAAIATAAGMKQAAHDRSSSRLSERYGKATDSLISWIERPELQALAQHETRGHMPSDLGRYLFASIFGKVRGYSPKASDFPEALHPDHRNWLSGDFYDRFRVQLADEPSTTITSHISKDGHYFIHPDPSQCRSLTVREAARLQTFPDDYQFLGNRTQQYV